MSYEIKLKVFTLRLRKSRAKKDPYRLWSDLFNMYDGDENEKFNAFFKSYVESFDKKFIQYKNWPKAMTIPQLDIHFKSQSRLFYGQLEGGPTNRTFQVKELDDPEKGVMINKNQVTTSPFYFIFYLPADANIGLLVVQSLGEHVMHDILQLNFQKFIKSIDADLTIDYREQITKEAVERFKKGTVQSITIRKSGLSKDAGDLLFAKKYEEYGGIKVELKVSFMNRIVNQSIVKDLKEKVFGKDPDIFEVDNLSSLGMDVGSDIFAKVDYNGKQTTARIDDGIKLSPIYHVDRTDVPLDAYNHPDSKKMKEYLVSFIQAMIKEVRLK